MLQASGSLRDRETAWSCDRFRHRPRERSPGVGPGHHPAQLGWALPDPVLQGVRIVRRQHLRLKHQPAVRLHLALLPGAAGGYSSDPFTLLLTGGFEADIFAKHSELNDPVTGWNAGL